MARDKDKLSYKEEHGVSRVGKFLQDAAKIGKPFAPALLEIASKITGVEDLDKLADKIRGEKEMQPQDKEVALALIEKDKVEEQEKTKRLIAKYDNDSNREIQISERWKADMASDDVLSKRTRPVLVLAWSLFAMILIVVDAACEDFDVPEYWISIIATMLITTVSGYFIVREISKRNKLKYL